jgi:hypothetical protein
MTLLRRVIRTTAATEFGKRCDVRLRLSRGVIAFTAPMLGAYRRRTEPH